jgi:hypothetical protein
LEVGAALRSHTLIHYYEEREKIVAAKYGMTGKDIDAGLKNSGVVFAVL